MSPPHESPSLPSRRTRIVVIGNGMVGHRFCERLVELGQVAKKHDLYCKITGGQRIDLLGARVDQLPDIWEELVAAGFESGHAYGKSMRTVKSCVGSTWCRYGVQDSTAFAIRIEERDRGIRMFYIQTAKPLQRTARWLEEFEGGIEALKPILLEDSLGICERLEADMQRLVETYRCEWKAVVESPELRARFRHFADSREADDAIGFVVEREQRRPTL